MEIFVSGELDCKKFILSLYPCDFVERVEIIKSEYKDARVDFLIFNRENLKHFVVETKDWLSKKPTFISVSKIRNIYKHYSGNGLLILSHNKTYYWLDILKIDWDNVNTFEIPKKNDEMDLCYDIENLLSCDIEKLSIVLLLRLIT